MRIVDEILPGTFLLEPSSFSDHRGCFVKTFHKGLFQDLGLAFNPAEEFYSTSSKGVLRGMHFQLPPHDHAKLVYCILGRGLDVLVDLRKKSPAFGRFASADLSQSNRHMIYVPTGVAHGFLAMESDTLMMYKTTSVHAPTHDAGIRWDSFGFDWGVAAPVLSNRDAVLPRLDDFVSPF